MKCGTTTTSTVRQCLSNTCNETFQPLTGRQRYCSKPCYDRQKQSRYRATTHCKQCGALIGASRPQLKRTRLCSDRCRETWIAREARKLSKKQAVLRTALPALRVLSAEASPVRVYGEILEGEASRRVWCAQYAQCLAYAEQQGWDGFACDGCSVTAVVMPEPKQQVSSGFVDV